MGIPTAIPTFRDPTFRKRKYTWMVTKQRDAQSLEADIDDMLNNFGTKFKFAF